MSTSPTAEQIFVGLRISNPQIHECVKKIQDSITPHNSRLKGRPLEKLHVTLMALNLEGGQIIKAGRILENQCKTVLKPIFDQKPMTLRFKGLGHFPDARPPVIYANLEQDGTEFLKLVNKTVTETFNKEDIHSKDPREYTPHMTVMKSRPKGRISKKDYESCKDWSIGEQTLTELTLHLCRANGDVQPDGFYECIATMTLPDSDETYSG